MTVQELINRLQKLDPNAPIMILDGFNGGGYPREINYGPVEDEIDQKSIDDCADCEEFEPGTMVCVMGYGFY